MFSFDFQTIAMNHNYFVYILMNKRKTVTYTGVTNDIETRLKQHYDKHINKKTFAGKYNIFYLVYLEQHGDIDHAIAREKEIKKWRREKKKNLITSINPECIFFNNPETGEIYFDKLPPSFQ